MTADTKRIPVCDTSDPAQLEAWYGSFGWADHVRKIVLATCAELIRAESVAEGAKLSESRVSDLAHTHEFYLEFTVQTLNGRRLRQQNLNESIERGNPLVDMRR